MLVLFKLIASAFQHVVSVHVAVELSGAVAMFKESETKEILLNRKSFP